MSHKHEAIPRTIFVTDERRVWMRLHDHVVIFEREPDFPRFAADSTGPVLRIVRIWVVFPGSALPRTQYYVRSVRYCARGNLSLSILSGGVSSDHERSLFDL